MIWMARMGLKVHERFQSINIQEYHVSAAMVLVML